MTEDGSVYSWGHNAFGEVGAGPVCPSVATTPRAVSSLVPCLSLYATRVFTEDSKEEEKLKERVATLLKVFISFFSSDSLLFVLLFRCSTCPPLLCT